MSKNFNEFEFKFEAVDDCLVCKNKVLIPNGRVKWHKFDFWYVICTQCGLKIMNPRPTRESYKVFYKDYFWGQKITNAGFHQEGQMWNVDRYNFDNDKKWDPKKGKENRIEKHKKQRADYIIPTVASMISIGPSSNILEIGCGFGVTLNEFKKKYHCNVYAIEPSLEAKKSLDEFGIELIGQYAEDLEGISRDGEKFDVIIFSHVLENTIDPLNVLASARDSLSKTGIIYLQTPNLLTFDQMNPYHPYIFSKTSMGRISEELGLKYKVVSDGLDKMLTMIFSK